MRALWGWMVLALLLVGACANPQEQQIAELAHYYAERLVDTLPPDSGGTPAIDSTTVDSLVGDWTEDDWIRFWEKVEEERANQRKAAELIAQRAAEEIEKKTVERSAEQSAEQADTTGDR